MADHRTIWYTGFIAGSIGAISVAIWFLIVDIIVGRPFFTPAALGSVVFLGVRDPAMVSITALPVFAYTGIHCAAFVLVGIIFALLFKEAEKVPKVLWYMLEFFIILEVGFYSIVGMLFTPLLAELAWINIAAGNLISSVGMGYYFWRTQPSFRKGLN